MGTCCVSLLTACAGTPIVVERMHATAVQRELNQSILTSDALSALTHNVLFKHDLVDRYEDDPRGAIASLHLVAAHEQRNPDDLFALAELSFAHAERVGDAAHHRAAMVYAWMFLFPPGERPPPRDPFDGQVRAAADFYNRGLARGFAHGPSGEFIPDEAGYDLPFGQLDVAFDIAQLTRGERRLTNFMPVSELDVRGLATRYRSPGVGAPLAASTEHVDPTREYADYIEPWAKVAVTALLRLDDAEGQLANGRVRGRLTLEFTALEATVDIHGEQVPLETESTASLALTFAEAPVWEREIGGFLQRVGAVDESSRLDTLTPYRHGAIPVVLVHGTASSPGRWAQMMNELNNDPLVGPRIQPWLFTYDTGNPIRYSAMLLRESLRRAITVLDPQGKDAALHNMVVMGHSQGGLLTKMTAIDSGDQFWQLLSDEPFDSADFDPEAREIIDKSVFIEPLPNVTRLIFLSTPHRGSYVAGNWLAHQLARLIVLPADITKVAAELVTVNAAKLGAGIADTETSVLDMTPGHPFVETLWSIPIAPGVRAHSIVAVEDPDQPRDQAGDGVVKYKSAHIDGVASEFVVTSGHSSQDNPHTIGEVRRILLEHIAEFDAARASPPSAAIVPQ
jgi:pimeloyl-ACP methyl ester carboxylesterase